MVNGSRQHADYGYESNGKSLLVFGQLGAFHHETLYDEESGEQGHIA